MCYGCWEEADKPMWDTPQVRALAACLKQVGPFGALHIFVDDWNCEDSNIRFCMGLDGITPDEMKICEFVLGMPVDERISALALADGFWTPKPDEAVA